MFEMIMMPCNSKNTEIAEFEEPISQECNPDLKAQSDYIKASNWLILANQERFMPEKFGEESVEQYSEIVNLQFDSNVPTWFNS